MNNSNIINLYYGGGRVFLTKRFIRQWHKWKVWNDVRDHLGWEGGGMFILEACAWRIEEEFKVCELIIFWCLLLLRRWHYLIVFVEGYKCYSQNSYLESKEGR